MSNKLRSKFFRVAVAGDTIDGRVIDPQWLLDAAATYNRETYGARVNVEHFLSMFPNWDMKAHGDVVALKTQEDVIDGEKRLALYAQIEPLESLVELVNSGQKIYTSIELVTNFAKTGKAYLTGLAVTDTPASLGTEVLSFAAQRNTFASDHLEATLEFEAEDDTAEKTKNAFTQLMGKIRDKITPFSKQTKDNSQHLVELAQVVDEAVETLTTGQNQTTRAVEEMSAQYDELAQKIQALESKYAVLDKTDASVTHRPAATGADPNAQFKTNC